MDHTCECDCNGGVVGLACCWCEQLDGPVPYPRPPKRSKKMDPLELQGELYKDYIGVINPKPSAVLWVYIRDLIFRPSQGSGLVFRASEVGWVFRVQGLGFRV